MLNTWSSKINTRCNFSFSNKTFNVRTKYKINADETYQDNKYLIFIQCRRFYAFLENQNVWENK